MPQFPIGKLTCGVGKSVCARNAAAAMTYRGASSENRRGLILSPSFAARRIERDNDEIMTTLHEPYNLQRFLDTQNPVFEEVCKELRAGQKQTHWMWFIFPQLQGLGHSSMAIKFAISSRKEAEAYLKHPVLGERLRKCTELVNLVNDRTIEQIFGYPDNLKFRSSMTLFASTALENQIFKDALEKYFAGELDTLTIERL
jgi:uncharacterized protein (DUF1810 family)